MIQPIKSFFLKVVIRSNVLFNTHGSHSGSLFSLSILIVGNNMVCDEMVVILLSVLELVASNPPFTRMGNMLF